MFLAIRGNYLADQTQNCNFAVLYISSTNPKFLERLKRFDLGHGRHNFCEVNILCICHCAIYKKHQLQLKREFRKQNTYVELILHHLSEKPCDIHFISVKLPKLCYSHQKMENFPSNINDRIIKGKHVRRKN